MTTSTLLLAAAAVATLTLGVQTASTTGGNSPPSEPCAITEALEMQALQGELDVAAVDCLESKGGGSEKANRLLMVNAFAAKDMERWRTYAAEEMQRARRDGGLDANIVLKLALYDTKMEDWESVVKLSEEGLQLLEQFPEGDREKREIQLLKVRALAGMKLQQAEPEDSDAADRAREWMEAWKALDP